MKHAPMQLAHKRLAQSHEKLVQSQAGNARLLTHENVQALAAGKINFDRFAWQTADEWVATARWLLRRWTLMPRAVEEQDVVQELLVGAWQAVDKFDAKRGVPLRSYVRFGALHRAMRWMHCQRNAQRRDGRNQSRFPVALSDLAPMVEDVNATQLLTQVLVAEPEQEELAHVRICAERLNELDRQVVCGIWQAGSVEDWVWQALGSQALRERQGVSTFRDAKARGLEVAAKLAAAL